MSLAGVLCLLLLILVMYAFSSQATLLLTNIFYRAFIAFLSIPQLTDYSVTSVSLYHKCKNISRIAAAVSIMASYCSCGCETFQTRCPPSSSQHCQNPFWMLCLLTYDLVKLPVPKIKLGNVCFTELLFICTLINSTVKFWLLLPARVNFKTLLPSCSHSSDNKPWSDHSNTQAHPEALSEAITEGEFEAMCWVVKYNG